MASLTQTAVISRKLVRWGIYTFILLILSKTIFDISSGIYRKLFPPAPPPPTLAFGKLTAIPFPKKDRPNNLSFKLETPDGGLPTFPTQAKVFFMPSSTSHLFSLETAKQRAQQLKFSPDGQEVSQTIFRFPSTDAPSMLEMNIVTGIFSISYDLAKDPSPLSSRSPAASTAQKTVESYLSGAGILPEDLAEKSTSEYLSLQKGQLLPAVSLSEAQLVKISLFRKEIEGLPSLTANPNESNIWFIVSSAKEAKRQIIAGEYHYYPVDQEKYATYSIKTATEAWDELAKGGGFIANLGSNEQGNIVIRRVYMAYFDPENATQFYQPIIVFEGDRGFSAYIPAVSNLYYTN